jgi:hypothetical protein
MATEYSDDFTVKDFEVADNIELHPSTDEWMAGDRFGMVSKIGVKYVYCLMDRSDKTVKMLPKNVGKWQQDKPIVKRHIPAKRFRVEGRTISTRSSRPDDRKLAKKIARKLENANG